MSFEISRRMHMHFYGSFLYCPKGDTLCTMMGESWKTGRTCRRQPCIVEDPKHLEEQARIEENRRAAAEAERQHRKEEKDAAPIRDQRNRIKIYIDQKLDEIHRIEEASRRAYSENKPNKGDELFNKARFMRGELKKFEKENLQKRGEKNDRQSDKEDHGRDDEDRRPARSDGGRTPDGEMHERGGSREAARAREIIEGAAQADLGRGPEA